MCSDIQGIIGKALPVEKMLEWPKQHGEEAWVD